MPAKTIMVQGTASGAGKSTIAAALCYALARKGLRVAPFKGWNMSRFSYKTPKGLEIGVAQGYQSELLGLEPCGEMNPIFLKVGEDKKIRTFVKGKYLEERPEGNFRDFAWPFIIESFNELLLDYDVLVIEGAGSPVELNIIERDMANMAVAKLASSPVIMVADVSIGGALAGLIGTFDLLPKQEQNLVIGSILNKFAGDPELMAGGIKVIEKYIKQPVLGLVPYFAMDGLPEEDSSGGEEEKPFDKKEGLICLEKIANELDLDYILLKMAL